MLVYDRKRKKFAFYQQLMLPMSSSFIKIVRIHHILNKGVGCNLSFGINKYIYIIYIYVIYAYLKEPLEL